MRGSRLLGFAVVLSAGPAYGQIPNLCPAGARQVPSGYGYMCQCPDGSTPALGGSCGARAPQPRSSGSGSSYNPPPSIATTVLGNIERELEKIRSQLVAGQKVSDLSGQNGFGSPPAGYTYVERSTDPKPNNSSMVAGAGSAISGLGKAGGSVGKDAADQWKPGGDSEINIFGRPSQSSLPSEIVNSPSPTRWQTFANAVQRTTNDIASGSSRLVNNVKSWFAGTPQKTSAEVTKDIVSSSNTTNKSDKRTPSKGPESTAAPGYWTTSTFPGTPEIGKSK